MTSPQAMNPLPNRPLLNNTSLPLTLPNVPSFDSMAFNGRPRKVMPEAGKDFPILNGMSGLLPGPPSAPTGPASQSNTLDRAGILGSTVLSSQQQHITGPPLGPQVQLQPAGEQAQAYPPHQPDTKDIENPTKPTAADLFRTANEAGEWKEKMGLVQDGVEAIRTGHTNAPLNSAVSSWDRQLREDDADVKPEEEPESEEEEQPEIGDAEGNRVWRAKRTLRKSVAVS